MGCCTPGRTCSARLAWPRADRSMRSEQHSGAGSGTSARSAQRHFSPGSPVKCAAVVSRSRWNINNKYHDAIEPFSGSDSKQSKPAASYCNQQRNLWLYRAIRPAFDRAHPISAGQPLWQTGCHFFRQWRYQSLLLSLFRLLLADLR